MKKHNLKITPEYFEKVIEGVKKFEIRYNDRNYKLEDILTLEEYDKGGYTGRYINTEVIYILEDKNYMKNNYVALGIKLRLEMGAKIE